MEETRNFFRVSHLLPTVETLKIFNLQREKDGDRKRGALKGFFFRDPKFFDFKHLPGKKRREAGKDRQKRKQRETP